MKKRYNIAYDVSRALLDSLPEIEADSPKCAAEEYAGAGVLRLTGGRGAEIVVQTTEWPIKMYLYKRRRVER